MKDKQRKKAQRKINKLVRALNQNIREDNLWRGRFVFVPRRGYGRSTDGGAILLKQKEQAM